MYLILPLVIAIELAIGIFTSTANFQNYSNKVLGSQIAHAQDSTIAPEPDLSSPSPAETPVLTTEPTPVTTDTPLPSEPSSNSSPQATSEGETTNPANTAAVINPDALLGSTENVSQQLVDDIQNEDTQIDSINDPVTQTETLINIANNNTNEIENFSKQNDWNNINFSSQRLGFILDKTIQNISNVPDNKATTLKEQAASICTNLNPVLRTSELTVPQDLEQDMEMVMGKCAQLK